MLVLSRAEQQGIELPGLGISVKVLEISGGKVKVGVEAPIEVRVLRDELVDKEAAPEVYRMRLPNSMRDALKLALQEVGVAKQDNLDAVFRSVVTRLESAHHSIDVTRPVENDKDSSNDPSYLDVNVIRDGDDTGIAPCVA